MLLFSVKIDKLRAYYFSKKGKSFHNMLHITNDGSNIDISCHFNMVNEVFLINFTRLYKPKRFIKLFQI